MKPLLVFILLATSTFACVGQSEPTLVADLTPGAGSTSFGIAAALGNKLVFIADTALWAANMRPKLYVTDGSAQGTQLLKTFSINGGPKLFKKLKNDLFFLASDSVAGRELWATDGTLSGTRIVKDIYSGKTGSVGNELIQLSDKLYFTANDGNHGIELWVSDGTSEGTRMVQDMDTAPGSGSIPENLLAVNDKLFFSAFQNGNNFQLWTFDPASSTLSLVKTISGQIGSIKAVNNLAVFTLTPSPAMSYPFFYLYGSNGTYSGTTQLAEGIYGMYLSELVGDKLYFFAISHSPYPFAKEGIWVTDGTKNGTMQIGDDLFNRCELVIDKQSTIRSFRSNVYFGASKDNSYHNQLWVSNGTSLGTRIFKDFSPSVITTAIAPPKNLLVLNDRLIFKAWDDSTKSVNLWFTDGTESGTGIIRPSNATSNYFGNAVCDIMTSPITVVDSYIYFGAFYDSASVGHELYRVHTSALLSDTHDDSSTVRDSIFEFQLFPNPVDNFLTVKANLKQPTNYSIWLMSPDGREAARWENNAYVRAGTNEFTYSVADLPPGIYFIRIVTAETQFSKAIVVRH